MRKRTIRQLLFAVLTVQSAFGQSVELDSLNLITFVHYLPRLTVGIDGFKNIPYAFFGNGIPVPTSSSARLHNKGIVEVILRKEGLYRRYWTALLGYTRAEIVDSKAVERRQAIQGWYGKGGKEWRLGKKRGHSTLGVRGIATYCKYTTDLRYDGPAFGDYTQRDVINNIGIGFEPYYAYDFFLGSRWLLRWETRWSHHYRIVGKGATPYYPGAGISFGFYNYVVSGGTTLQLHYVFVR